MQIRGSVNEAAGLAQDAYGKAADQAEDLYDDVNDRARDVVSKSRRRIEGRYEDLEQMVIESPMPALAIAVGVGFLLGLLLGSSGTAYAVRR
jgi:ElaB/YqjD/DUF883 family membrane-anchored ribosome-binding protein